MFSATSQRLMSHACAACGPGSLWGLPHPASQCALSRDGFDLWQDKLYVKCTGCNNKYGHDCLHKLSQKAHEYERSLSEDEHIHDPQGVYKMLKAQPWRDGTDPKVLSECRAAGFQQWTSGACATIPHCIDCEQGTIPEPAFSDAAEVIKASTADYDRRVVLLVPLADQLLSGDMAQLKVSVIDFVNAYPLLPTVHCKPAFQGGEGTEAVMGSAPPRPPSPTLALAAAATTPPPPTPLAEVDVFHKAYDWPTNLPTLPHGLEYSHARTTLIGGNSEPRPPRQVSPPPRSPPGSTPHPPLEWMVTPPPSPHLPPPPPIRWRRGARGTPATGSRRRRTSSSSWRWRRSVSR